MVLATSWEWTASGLYLFPAIAFRFGDFEMAKEDYHVVPRVDGWAVQREGGDRASSLHDTQADAIGSARDLARRNHTELVIHGRNGKIRDSDSYGNDPCPPRDKKH